jgi:hypothetical protein
LFPLLPPGGLPHAASLAAAGSAGAAGTAGLVRQPPVDPVALYSCEGWGLGISIVVEPGALRFLS